MEREIPSPLEGHTFLKCPAATIEDVMPGVAAVIGVPFDATKVSRLGARDGPQAIREATFVFAFLMDATPGGFVDLDADLRFERAPEMKLVDLGNVPAIPIDVEGTSRRVSDRVAGVVERGGFPVVLGGDHFVAYPSMRGFAEGLRRAHPGSRMGYVHVDMHLDLTDHVPYWGKYASGSPARRISEIDGIDPTKMVFVGINGPQPNDDVEFVRRSGVRVIPMSRIKREGVKTVARRVQDLLVDCDRIYVSIDIDVVDRTFAPGTGNAVTMGGLLPDELLELVHRLRELPLGAVDMMEVAPNWDPTGRTQALAATALIEALTPRIFKVSPAGTQGLTL